MPRVCDNCHFQAVGEPLARLLDQPVIARRPRRFVHLCNPYRQAAGATDGDAHGPDHDRRTAVTGHATVQQVTYAAMARARQACRTPGPASPLEVEFLAAVYPEDREYASAHFDRCFALRRSAPDVEAFARPRRLPLLFDTIEGAAADTDADSVVFTNVDICPVPHFYRTIDALLSRGFDALVINRRTLTGWPVDPGLIDVMALDAGRAHEGYDCFVFPRAAVSRFVRNNAVIGAGGVMRGLIYNLVATCTRVLFLGDVHLTWHLGDDKVWATPEFRDYIEHNWSESLVTLLSLARAQPGRFRELCRHFPDSRVDVVVDDGGRVGLRRKPDFDGFLPDLAAVAAEVERRAMHPIMIRREEAALT